MVREREGGREGERREGGREGGQAGRELEGVGRVMGLRVGGEGKRIKRGGGGGCREWALWLLYMMDTWGGGPFRAKGGILKKFFLNIEKWIAYDGIVPTSPPNPTLFPFPRFSTSTNPPIHPSQPAYHTHAH